jgi:outer membrane protein OmpA-like peptidoglycan-associated protein
MRTTSIPLAAAAAPWLLLAALCAPANAFQDAAGTKDPALFPNRMPGFDISRAEVKDFDSFEFLDAKRQKVSVEGKRTSVLYVLKEGAKEPSRIQILRNYQSAFTKIGGVILVPESDGDTYMRLVKGSQEVWVHVSAYITTQYFVNIVEKGGMNQDVTADAAALSNDISSTGHAAVYGILFDTGKADIKPESTPALDQVAALLKSQAALKVHIVGHTDNAGNLDANMKLSQARAEAVVQVLATKYGIDKARMRAFGVASLAPVAPNDTEEGRAKNRRVELVKP